MSQDQQQRSWTLLTAHGRTLVAIAQDPETRMRDLAVLIGVTERTVQAIVADLETAGYLTRARVGRRNRYTVDQNRPFRHPAQDGHLVGPLLDLLAGRAAPTAPQLAAETPPAVATAVDSPQEVTGPESLQRLGGTGPPTAAPPAQSVSKQPAP